MQKIDFKELKDVMNRVLKGISFENKINKIKTIAGFDVVFSGTKFFCGCVVFNYETKEIIEKKYLTGEEIMRYSPNFSAFREGSPILEIYKMLENKPDVLIIDGQGAIHPKKVGIASYIGVLLNVPTIGVSKDLIYGRLDEDNILFDEELKGKALRTKEFARPIYISPGHNINIDLSVEIIKKFIGKFKMPLPLHLAHKYANKIKHKNS